MEKISCLEDMDSYVMIMSKNHVLDHFQKLAKEKEYQEKVWRRIEKSEDQIVNSLVEREIKAQLDSIFKKLPARQQEMFGLSHHDGLTFKEIAEKLEIAPNTTKNHLTRALKVVRSQSSRNRSLFLFGSTNSINYLNFPETFRRIVSGNVLLI